MSSVEPFEHLRLMSVREVAAVTSLSTSSVWRLAGKTLPAPIEITKGRKAWRAAEVRAWLEKHQATPESAA